MTVAGIIAQKGREVVTIEPQRTLAEAAALLAGRRIGAVVVLGPEERVVGIFSERDLVRVLASRGPEGLSEPVQRHMTEKVMTCGESTSIVDLMGMMTEGKFRHVPVLEGGRLAGLVSIGDVVKVRLAEIEAESRAMRDYIATA